MRDPARDVERLEQLREVVTFLCSPECGGRAAGSPEGARARTYLEAAFELIGLEPAGEQGFRQPVPTVGGVNIIGKLPGQGPLAERAVLVAAHYDHLGWARPGVAFWGADDNAAAVAILLDTARALAASRTSLTRQVVFCAFDAEEPPFFLTELMGSRYFTRHPTVPLDRIDMMVCMDLMGHALGSEDLPESVRKTLFVLGAEHSPRTAELVRRASVGLSGLEPRRLASGLIPALSDYHAFQLEEVPFLFLTNGRGAHYHRVTDTPEKLDYEKMLRSADFLRRLVLELSNLDDPRIAYLPAGHDDRGSLESLREVALALAPQAPPARRLLPAIEALLTATRTGDGLSAADRRRVAQLVFAMEGLLSGG